MQRIALYQKHRNIRSVARFISALLFFVVFYSTATSYAATSLEKSENGSSQLVEYLNQEKIDLIRTNTESSILIEPLSESALQQQIKRNAAMFALIHAKIASLESFLVNQRNTQKLLAFKIKKVTMSPGHLPNDPVIQEQLARLNALNTANNQTIALIIDNLALAHHSELVLLNAKRQLEEWSAKKQGIQHLEEIQKKIEALHHDRNLIYEKNVQLQKSKNTGSNFNLNYDNELKLQLNNQNIALINAQGSFLELQIKWVRTDDLLLRQRDIKTIISSIELYKDVINQLDVMKESLSQMVDLIKEEQQYLDDKGIKQSATALGAKVTAFIKDIDENQKKLNESLDLRQQDLKQQLSVRQTLAGQTSNWMNLKNEFVHAPVRVGAYLSGLFSKSKEAYLHQGVWLRVFMWTSLLIVFISAVFLNQKLRLVAQDKTRSRLSAHLYDLVVVLLARNAMQIAFMAMLMLTFLCIQLPFSAYSLFIDLFMVWFIFRNSILIARLILLERAHDISGNDARFFYRLKWLLVAGCITTMCMVVSQQIPLSIPIQDVFTRLFMLFIFAAAFVMWAGKDVFPLLLRPLLKARKRYTRNAITLLFILLPLTLITTAVIGLVGYMNLAWSMSRYQAYLVLVIIGYVLARGLLSDALEIISEWMISSLRHGWLWIEVFLKPLDKIMHLVLFLGSVVLLFELFGVYTEIPVLQWLSNLGNRELVDVSGVHITLNSTLEFLIVLAVFIWTSKWTREFCYRWLYVNSRDEGIRNSLSVFTQYAVILLGGYITLRVLGLDFSGMSMILGGLAVGMGFGLRDFASNIVGGVMLLIERPVREGDLITLGGHEGRVAHIGIRSMRVSSWDNTEVLIPNAETFNKPFINWTHQDSIVRTVVPIKVSREDDPILIQRLILDVLAIIPEVLQEPPTQVFLKQIDEALIEFEVRYFIDIEAYTRFEVRSKFLFALTAQFKAAGIKPPIPPFSVEIKDSGRDDVISKTKPKE